MDDMKDKFNLEDFKSQYKGTNNFCNSELFQVFYDSLENKELYSHIIFNNDIMQIPPIQTFVKYMLKTGDKTVCETFDANSEDKYLRTIKRCLGACFGYLFKFMLGYKNAISTWVGDPETFIKNASYFAK